MTYEANHITAALDALGLDNGGKGFNEKYIELFTKITNKVVEMNPPTESEGDSVASEVPTPVDVKSTEEYKSLESELTKISEHNKIITDQLKKANEVKVELENKIKDLEDHLKTEEEFDITATEEYKKLQANLDEANSNVDRLKSEINSIKNEVTNSNSTSSDRCENVKTTGMDLIPAFPAAISEGDLVEVHTATGVNKGFAIPDGSEGRQKLDVKGFKDSVEIKAADVTEIRIIG